MNTIKVLISEQAGIYIPRNFYENFAFDVWNVALQDYFDLSSPDNDQYWNAWDDLLAHAEYHDDDGHIWRLYQDGDLFAVRDDHDFE
jgi:hypothetical protein